MVAFKQGHERNGERLEPLVELLQGALTADSVAEEQHGIHARKNAIPPTSDLLRTIAQLIGEGHVKPTIAHTFSLQEATQAHELSQSGHGRGRILLHIAE